MALPERYQGRPLLLLVEAYALAVIGEQPAEAEKLVRQVWGGGEDWRATVREQLAWEATIDQTIETNWSRYLRETGDRGIPPSPTEFAMAFADAIEKQSR
jgi:hypothetical protein